MKKPKITALPKVHTPLDKSRVALLGWIELKELDSKHEHTEPVKRLRIRKRKNDKN